MNFFLIFCWANRTAAQCGCMLDNRALRVNGIAYYAPIFFLLKKSIFYGAITVEWLSFALSRSNLVSNA